MESRSSTTCVLSIQYVMEYLAPSTHEYSSPSASRHSTPTASDYPTLTAFGHSASSWANLSTPYDLESWKIINPYISIYVTPY